MFLIQAVEYNNQALELQKQGDYQGAEKLYLSSLQIKLDALGEDHTTTALSRNALGELYLTMGRLDDAEDQLKRAFRVRKAMGPVMDAAISVENLAQAYEARGDLGKALGMRLSYNTDEMMCGNSDVSDK
ncbi:hypothetical protein D9756_000978 [Leucocoprinus leucothites]|uniref:Kinesin light chain n=1 Tax=Leucocoprinus leucothites TaxID=201217 RepID=A0A8H5LNF8_9AGAR|nr:hypothetical protein D9756_000978 [Leucoagaricus leucothites]